VDSAARFPGEEVSQLLELGLAAGGPAGVAIGIIGKGWFDRKVRRATGKLTEAQGIKTDAEAAQILTNTAVLLVAPLQSQITELTGQVVTLTTRVGTLEAENTEAKTKFQLAISHIRSLRTWISNQFPGQNPPPAPAGLGL
jgi:hypothetical protein